MPSEERLALNGFMNIVFAMRRAQHAYDNQQSTENRKKLRDANALVDMYIAEQAPADMPDVTEEPEQLLDDDRPDLDDPPQPM